MINLKSGFCFTLFLVFLIGAPACLTILYNKYKSENFNCDSLLVVKKGNTRLALALSYYFEGKNGMVFFKGTFKQGNNVTYVSRNSKFTFVKKRGYFKFYSTEVTSTAADTSSLESLSHYLPDFYLKKGVDLEFSIFPVKNLGFIFSTGYVPSMYCVLP